MKPNDVLMISINFYGDLGYDDPLDMIRSYFSEKDRFYFQLYMFYLHYKVKVRTKLHVRWDFDTELVVLKREGMKKKVCLVITGLNCFSCYD